MEPKEHEAPRPGPKAPPRTPDAIIVPAGWVAGETALDRNKSLKEALAPHFGMDPKGRGIVWAHNQGDHNFVHADPSGSRNIPNVYRYFPGGHPTHAGQDRYDWEDQPNGLRFGYLIDEAK